ncbi:MAG: hypothetical protein WC284_11530 [Candidimonas sp.]
MVDKFPTYITDHDMDISYISPSMAKHAWTDPYGTLTGYCVTENKRIIEVYCIDEISSNIKISYANDYDTKSHITMYFLKISGTWEFIFDPRLSLIFEHHLLDTRWWRWTDEELLMVNMALLG